ncbi:hypothetical protein Tco_0655279 [Tanacetum coccineum]|uniref:Uncharacterized protein n=1 Tax=Tanacetum coccineum TaxID=301880 RepID=A0ABQ4X5L2_9ASTR
MGHSNAIPSTEELLCFSNYLRAKRGVREIFRMGDVPKGRVSIIVVMIWPVSVQGIRLISVGFHWIQQITFAKEASENDIQEGVNLTLVRPPWFVKPYYSARVVVWVLLSIMRKHIHINRLGKGPFLIGYVLECSREAVYLAGGRAAI